MDRFNQWLIFHIDLISSFEICLLHLRINTIRENLSDIRANFYFEKCGVVEWILSEQHWSSNSLDKKESFIVLPI